MPMTRLLNGTSDLAASEVTSLTHDARRAAGPPDRSAVDAAALRPCRAPAITGVHGPGATSESRPARSPGPRPTDVSGGSTAR